MTELLLLRLRYGKGLREFEIMRDDARAGTSTPEAFGDLLKDLLGKDSGVDASPLTEEAFADVVSAAMAGKAVRTRLALDDKGEPMEVPCGVWLERFSMLTIVPQ